MLNTTTSLIVEMSQKFTFNSADYEKVRLVFERGVEEGDATSMGNLGLIYRNGWGVDRDYLKARDLFEKGAALNNANAMYSIGALYADGLGVPQRLRQGTRAVRESRPSGDNSVAMQNARLCFAPEWPRRAAQDYAKAREWYEKAAAKGTSAGHEPTSPISMPRAMASPKTTLKRASGSRRRWLKAVRLR